MAVKKNRRRRAPLEAEEIVSTGARVLDVTKFHLKWLILGGVALVLVLGAWGFSTYRQQSRETQAQAVLDQLRPRLKEVSQAGEVIPALDRLAQDYAGTLAGQQALLFKGHLLYQTKKYAEAARAYEDLLAALKGRDPGGLTVFITENLSYCYEALGEFGRAAQVLQPVADQAVSGYRGEILGRLALLFDKAGNSKEARLYLERQLKEPLDPSQKVAVRERLAALEARGKEGKK